MQALYGSQSSAHDRYCGFRYIPSDPSDPGEIVYFFFPMFLFKDPQIRATAKVVLSDWFGLPDPDLHNAGNDGAELEGVDLDSNKPASDRIQAKPVHGERRRAR
jgi:hypothetical protein